MIDDGEAADDIDLLPYRLFSATALNEIQDALTALPSWSVAAGVGHGVVGTNRCLLVAEVSVNVAETTAAGEVPLEVVPPGCDFVVQTVHRQVTVLALKANRFLWERIVKIYNYR